MSEQALTDYVDEAVRSGTSARTPSDTETRDLAGTVQLARAALSGPAASTQAEEQSRERLLAQIEAAPPPRRTLEDLSEAPAQESWLSGILRKLFGR